MAKILFVDEELFLKRSELLAELSNKLEFQKNPHNSHDIKMCEEAKNRYVPRKLFHLSIQIAELEKDMIKGRITF